LGQWGRLKEAAIQCIERIVSGEVTLLAPGEELIINGLKVHVALHENQQIALLCAPSVFSVSLWFTMLSKNNHRGTENTEVAQRRSPIRDF
jgi:hypothetical protein